jgi:uncharacterized protein YodC (DUF2158 family)
MVDDKGVPRRCRDTEETDMSIEESARFERVFQSQSRAFIGVGDVVRLDIPGDAPAIVMTVVEVVRSRGRALCVWQSTGGAPQRAMFDVLQLEIVHRAPERIDGSLEFHPDIASVLQHPAIGAKLRSGGRAMSALVRFDVPDTEEYDDERLLDLAVECSWHDDDGLLWVEQYPLVALTGMAA